MCSTFYIKSILNGSNIQMVIMCRFISNIICHNFRLLSGLFFQVRCVARCVPKTQQFIIHTSHKHLETSLFLHGKHFTNVVRNNFNSLLFQNIYCLTIYNQLFHQCGCTGTINDQHYFFTRLDTDIFYQCIYHNFCCFIVRFHGLTTTAAFTMLTHTNFHIIFAKVCQSGTSGRMCCTAYSNSQCSHIISKSLCNGCYFFQTFAFCGSSTGNFVSRDTANQTSSVISVFTRCVGYIFLCNHFDAVDALFIDLFHGKFGCEHITGMVQYNIQNTFSLIRQFDGIYTCLRARSRKNVAHYGNIHHTFPNKTGNGGFVSRSSLCNNGYTISVFQTFINDHILVAAIDDFLVCQNKTIQQFIC